MTLWTPSNLTTAPVEWFKGDAGITTSSGEVTAWAQQGTKTGGMTRPSGYTGPTTSTLNSLVTTVWNGVPSLGLQSTATRSYSSGAMAAFALSKRTSGRTSTYDIVLNTDVPWNSINGFCIQYDTGSSGIISAYGGNGFGGNAPYGQVTSAPGPATDGYWHTLEALWGTTTAMYYDGNVQTLSSSSAGSFPALSGYLLDIGFNPDGNNTAGEIAEVILLNYAPTSTERQQIEGYLAWKWGVSGSSITDLVGNLPSGHPYKSAAPTTGPVPIGGTASITEAADTISSAGNLKVQATASITEAADTLSSAGKLLINATASLTESADTLTSTGTLPGVTGTAAITEEGDFVTSAGQLSLQGTASITEGSDVVASAGAVAIAGTASITEAADTLSASGVGPGRQGTASITEADDTVVSAAKVFIAGTASITEGADTATSVGALSIKGTLAYTDDPDTIFSLIGQLLIQGTASITEGPDTVASAGARVVSGSVNITEGNDTVAAVGGGTVTVNVTGSIINIFEGSPGFQYGWVQPAVGSDITVASGHIDSRSWVPAVPGTAVWVKVNA